MNSDFQELDQTYTASRMPEEPSRQNLIAKLRSALEPLPFVRAAWLEGADAAGRADAYSDVDLWLDVDVAREEQAFTMVRDTVSTFGPLNVDTARPHPDPLVQQRFCRTSGLSPFWFVDVCVQTHGRQMSFSPDDQFNVLFDRAEVIQANLNVLTAEDVWHGAQAINRQRWRFLLVEKEMRRGHMLEALAYYHDEVLGPLLELLRLRYVPGKRGYGLKHVSADLPRDAVDRMEVLYAFTEPEELTQGVERAELWFDELLLELWPRSSI